MEAAGFKKTADQCSSKIKKVKFEYRKIRDKHVKTGDSMKLWIRFWDISQPASELPVVIESGDIAAHTGENELSAEGEGVIEADGEESSSMLGNSSGGGSRAETPVNVDTKATPANL